ncbi:MAG: uracil-DNA glycosylase [Sandaracinus sp.]
MDERDDEQGELLAEVRAHLDWEAAWSGFPVPVVQAPVFEAAAFAPSATPPAAPVPRAPEAVPARMAATPVAPAAPSTSLAEALAALPPTDREGRLRVLADEAARCTRCRLHEGRKKSVFARGSAHARIAFVGEGPGFNEDQQGLPFVGAAGQLLDKMVGAMGLGRDDVYVCNVVKCRPPENRTPLPDEAGACSTFLVPQLEIVQPEVIVALGRCAAENLGVAEAGRSWRGQWGAYRGVPVMPTYHPAYLLRSPEMKKPVWEDLQLVMQRLGLKRGGD